MTTGEQLLQIIQEDDTLSYYADSFTRRAKNSAKPLPPEPQENEPPSPESTSKED